jgi:hypothetical protein
MASPLRLAILSRLGNNLLPLERNRSLIQFHAFKFVGIMDRKTVVFSGRVFTDETNSSYWFA